MKFNEIRKKLLAESAVIFGILAVLGAVGYGLDDLTDSYSGQASTLTGQVSSADGELSALRDKYTKIQKNAALYDEVSQKKTNDMLGLDRQFIRDKLDDLKKRYSLSNLHLTLSATQEVQDKKAKGKNNVIISSDATLTFDALTDGDAYNFVQALQQELSGTVRVTQFNIQHKSTALEQGLRAIIETGSYTFFSNTVKFTWFGLKPVDASAPSSPPGLPGMPPGMNGELKP